MKKVLALSLCLLLLTASAAADTLTLNGTIAAGRTVEVYAPVGGTVEKVSAEVGQTLEADDPLFTFRTNKVYATENGKVTGVFGQPGDTADTVAQRYGAILYLEGDALFTVSASTEGAYNASDTKFVHVGERVYLQCRSSSERSGSGLITAIDGAKYTIRVTSGALIEGDSVDVYRDAARSNTQKVGRGTVSRLSPTAVTASGAIVRVAVANGDKVQRGDLLLETLDGSFDGLYMSGTTVSAGSSGVLGSLNVNQGGSVQKNAVVAVLYPLEGMRVEATVPEDSRSEIHEGDRVLIELESDESISYEGTVTMVSAVAEQGASEVCYKVLVDFTPDQYAHFGMGVLVTTLEESADAEASHASAE